jgi:hypothetical protein
MKPLHEQNYYELLDLPPDSTREQIEAAFAKAMAYYGPDSIATYSLVPLEESRRFMKLIEEAYLTLSDAEARRYYDIDKGFVRKIPPPEIHEAPRVSPWLGSSPLDDDDDENQQIEEFAKPPQDLHRSPVESVASVSPASQKPESEHPVEVTSEDLLALAASIATAPSTPAPSTESERLVLPASVIEPEREMTVEVSAPLERESPEVPTPPILQDPEPSEPFEEMAEDAQMRPQREVSASKPPAKSTDVAPDTVFTGEVLRRVRESRGLSLRELSDRIRIGVSHLENIEADQYRSLPVTVYLRGFLMSLARELKLDPLKVSKSYLDLVANARQKN